MPVTFSYSIAISCCACLICAHTSVGSPHPCGEENCPAVSGAAMMQVSSYGALDHMDTLDHQAGERGALVSSDTLDHQVGERGAMVSVDTLNHEAGGGGAMVSAAFTRAAYAAQLQRKVAAVNGTSLPAFDELEKMITKFIGHQTDSEDQCSSQLLEAKHQLNQLHDFINDLAAEINETQTAISVKEPDLEEAREAATKKEDWKDGELDKCKEKTEERRRTLTTLRWELEEMHHIARPNVSMDLKAGKMLTGVALLEEKAAEIRPSGSKTHVAGVQDMVLYTKNAAAAVMTCQKNAGLHTTKAVAATLLEVPTEAPDLTEEECAEQKKVLEETYVKTYVELSRLVSETQVMVISTSCEDNVHSEFDEKNNPNEEEINKLTKELEDLNDKLRELRPKIEDAWNAEKKLREQIAKLTEECELLPDTVSNLDKVRELIGVMDKCPGLGAAKFDIPVWTGTWVTLRQTPDMNDQTLDAALNAACAKGAAAEGGSDGGQGWAVRAAEVGEIMSLSIQGMTTTNTAEGAVIGACPLCAGDDDKETGATHASGHARVCWDVGAEFSEDTMRKGCSTGERAVLCVHDRGDVRNQTREQLRETAGVSGDMTVAAATNVGPPSASGPAPAPAPGNSPVGEGANANANTNAASAAAEDTTNNRDNDMNNNDNSANDDVVDTDNINPQEPPQRAMPPMRAMPDSNDNNANDDAVDTDNNDNSQEPPQRAMPPMRAMPAR